MGTRELVVHRSYIIVYRVRKERVEILAVQHTRRR
jgi:plasmid stabilization system protein ParE